MKIAAEFSRFGYRMIRGELRRRGFDVNAKRVRRLMREENLVIQVRRFVATSEYHPNHGDWPNLVKNRAIASLNDVWAADIAFIDLGREFVYLAVIIDLCSRGIRGWWLDCDLSSALTHRALDRALAKHGPPAIHHSDHGVQYMAAGYVEKLEQHGIAVSTSAKGKPMQNGACERFMRTLKTEPTETPLDARVVEVVSPASVSACPWALLELARWCQEHRARFGGSESCRIGPLPHPPPRLNPSPRTEPRWQDLPSRQQEELLQRLGRMLEDRLANPDAPAEGSHEPH